MSDKTNKDNRNMDNKAVAGKKKRKSVFNVPESKLGETKSARTPEAPEKLDKGATEFIDNAKKAALESDWVPALSDKRKVIDEMNQEYALVWVGNQCLIMQEQKDITGRIEVAFKPPEEVKRFLMNKPVWALDKKGNIEPICSFNFWMRSQRRRDYKGVVFMPSGCPEGYYNLWRGFAVESNPHAKCDLYLKHIEENIADGNPAIYKYILDWMADAVQNPAKRPGTSIVMRGKMGVGKGVLAKYFGAIFGHHYIIISNSKHLVGNFNAHLREALIVFADEATWGGDKTAEGVLKSMVTEDKIMIEAKGRDAVQAPNYIRLLVSSNNDWVVPAGLEERRFFIFDVGVKHLQDAEYFEAIRVQMEQQSGIEALFHFLKNRKLDGVELRSFPQTAALMESKLATASPAIRFWYDCLMEGRMLKRHEGWEDRFGTDEFYTAYVNFCNDEGARHPGDKNVFVKEVKKVAPLGKACKVPRPYKTKERDNGHEVPSLAECRAYFDKQVKFATAWPSEHGSY